jgi:hypothetical protein
LLVTAVTNLIDNAVNYSPPGAPVSVSRAVRGDMVEIAVTDRGIGIAPEHQRRVFERFFRIDPARSRATGGTGLGLAIVKHVAANHGGSAGVWSRPGTGSTFTLRIPQQVGPGDLPGDFADHVEARQGRDRGPQPVSVTDSEPAEAAHRPAESLPVSTPTPVTAPVRVPDVSTSHRGAL